MAEGLTLDGRLAIEYQSAMKQMLSMFRTTMTQMAKTTEVMGTKVDKGLTKPLKNSHIAASKTYGYLKDIGRIVQGIFISQVLYRGILQPIQEAVKELWNFNMELERTELSFKYLLKATEDLAEGTERIADALMKTLKILAAQTPFIMSTVTSAAQTLLALGFKLDQINPILVLMADLAAATGGASDQMKRLAEALGKVQQRGRMTMREFRLFVSAKVPIMDILEKELGFEGLPTKMAIPAGIILPAILRYIMRFKGAAAEMEMTMSGLLSSIHDYFLFISRDIFSGFFDVVKVRLTDLRAKLAELWEVFNQFGVEGIIANLFPAELALSVWQLLHVFKELGTVIGQAWKAFEPLRKELFSLGLVTINWVVKGFIILSKIIQGLTSLATNSSISMRIFAATLLGLMIAAQVSTALAVLIKTMQKLILFTGGAVRVIGLLVGLLTVLALTIPRVRNWFSNLGNTILSLFGIQIPQSIMATNEAIAGISAASLGDIDWQQLIDGFSDVEEGAEGAADTITKKFLAAFDEVYNIPEKAEGKGLSGIFGDLGELGDFAFPDIGIGGLETPLAKMVAENRNIAKELWDIWKQYVAWWWDTFLDGWNIVIDIAKKGGKLLWETVKGLHNVIVETLTKTVVFVSTVLNDLGIAIGKTIKILVDMIIQLTDLFGRALMASSIKIGELLVIIGKIVIDFFGTLGKNATTGMTVIYNIISGGLELVTATFVSGLALILDIVGSGGDAIGQIFVALMEFIKKPTISGFKEMSTNIKDIVGGWITDTAGKITGWASNTAQSFTDWKTNSTTEISNWKKDSLSTWDTFGTEANTKLTTWKTEFGAIWTTWKDDSIETLELATTDLTTVWDTFKADTKKNFEIWTSEIGQIWTDYFTEVNEGWADFIGEVETQLLAYNIKVLGGVESLLGNIANVFRDGKNELKDSVWTYWQGAIESQRKAFEEMANMPRPAGASVPAFGAGGIIGVPHAAHGMIVGKDQLVRVGERGESEMIQPLNKTSMKPFAEMIGNLINNNQGGTVSSDYVMVPINKRDLERELYTIRLQEARRTG